MILLFFGFSGCDSLFPDNDKIRALDEPLSMWVAEEIIPEFRSTPNIYLSLHPGRMYNAGNELAASVNMIGSTIKVDVQGMRHQDGDAFPTVMLWPDLHFPIGAINGQYNIIVNYNNRSDLYALIVSEDVISIEPLDTLFSHNVFNTFRRYESNTFACNFFFPVGIDPQDQSFYNGVLDSLNLFDGITEIDYAEDRIALSFGYYRSYSETYFPDSSSTRSTYFRYDNHEVLSEIKTFVERKKEDVYSLYNHIDIIDWSE